MKWFWVFFLLSLPAEAALLQEAFTAQITIQQLEGKLKILSARTDLTPEAQKREQRKLSADLTAARIALNDILAASAEDPWEQTILQRIAAKKPATNSLDPEALKFLETNLPAGKLLSVLEWNLIQIWFGRTTQEAYLRQAFSMEEAPTEPKLALLENAKIIWVLNPYRKILPSSDSPEAKDVAALNSKIETLEISGFPELDAQAQELRLFLRKFNNAPLVLVSSGEASAMVNKMLDLYPALRTESNVQLWLNLNGRLFGQTPPKPTGRKLASISSASPASAADTFEAQTLAGLKQLRLETFERPTPLGKGFPIINVVAWEKNKRPTENLRESLIAEGTTWVVQKGPVLPYVKVLLK